jgi:DNA-binding NtrC family response regulator
VLVVDDDAAVRSALRLVLDEHHDVVEASDGGAALALLNRDRVDVMTLDLLLPKIDGFQVLQRMRTLSRHIPVIVISGINTSWTAATAMRLGAAAYITNHSTTPRC